MKRANILVNGIRAGELQELERGRHYLFMYLPSYSGPSVSLEMPTTQQVYHFDRFPPFFEGLLPEGVMLDGLLRQTKIDRDDFLAQLVTVGADLIGNVTVEAAE